MKAFVLYPEATPHRSADAHRLSRRGASLFRASGLVGLAERAPVYETQLHVVAFACYSTLAANAIVVVSDGSFSDPSAASAHAVFAGAPLNAPVSAAQLFNRRLCRRNYAATPSSRSRSPARSSRRGASIPVRGNSVRYCRHAHRRGQHPDLFQRRQ
jgi:hypothetical protein